MLLVPLAREKFWIKACALGSAMATGSRALPLLCKKTRFLPGDVTRLVREYLRLHANRRCPAWIDDLLWQQLRGLEVDTYISMTVWATRNIDHAIYRQDWTWLGMSSSDEEETNDNGAQVTVELDVYRSSCHWKLKCMRGNTQLRKITGCSCRSQASITNVLHEIRGHFACRRARPSATMEVPSSWQEWRSFVSLWLFGPQAPAPQATLAKWLRRRPASDNGELCHECGKAAAPGRKHSVRRLGRAFCSAQCAAAYTVLSCRICKQPVSGEQPQGAY